MLFRYLPTLKMEVFYYQFIKLDLTIYLVNFVDISKIQSQRTLESRL